MKTTINNVQQFENLTKCSRGTSKKTIDSFIESYNITNDDLIADIYANCGIDGLEEDIEFTKVNSDINGNPRYVCHFLDLLNDTLRFDYSIDISEKYNQALKLAKKIGGKKFHNKQYGGGIIFQSYNIQELKKDILKLKNN